MPLVGLDCYVMRVPAAQPVDRAVSDVSHEPGVLWSEPMRTYRSEGSVSTDPLFAAQPAAKAWRLADLHHVATGRGVVVAVVDSKVEVGHPDLVGQFVANQDFVGGAPVAAERHGTGIAGVIAAKQDNGIGIAGVAPAARLMALRACWQTGPGIAASTLCNTLALAKAIHFAIAHRAQVINLSLAGPPDQLLAALIGVAEARRIAVVAAFDPALPHGGFPASVEGVIAVANDSLPSFPSGVYGAPGNDVPTTQPGGTWYLVNGSSYAAAHVSGLVALLREESDGAAPRFVAARPTSGPIDAFATIERLAHAAGGGGPRTLVAIH
jgi:subtilisin family serine protease